MGTKPLAQRALSGHFKSNPEPWPSVLLPGLCEWAGGVPRSPIYILYNDFKAILLFLAQHQCWTQWYLVY